MKRRRIHTYGGKPARRNLTVADLIALRGHGRKLPGRRDVGLDAARRAPKALEALDARPIFHS